jgi:hypothetical protein
VNIHSGAADFSIHFGPERIFTSRRNPYSHHPGTIIHMPRNPQGGSDSKAALQIQPAMIHGLTVRRKGADRQWGEDPSM